MRVFQGNRIVPAYGNEWPARKRIPPESRDIDCEISNRGGRGLRFGACGSGAAWRRVDWRRGGAAIFRVRSVLSQTEATSVAVFRRAADFKRILIRASTSVGQNAVRTVTFVCDGTGAGRRRIPWSRRPPLEELGFRRLPDPWRGGRARPCFPMTRRVRSPRWDEPRVWSAGGRGASCSASPLDGCPRGVSEPRREDGKSSRGGEARFHPVPNRHRRKEWKIRLLNCESIPRAGCSP